MYIFKNIFFRERKDSKEMKEKGSANCLHYPIALDCFVRALTFFFVEGGQGRSRCKCKTFLKVQNN